VDNRLNFVFPEDCASSAFCTPLITTLLGAAESSTSVPSSASIMSSSSIMSATSAARTGALVPFPFFFLLLVFGAFVGSGVGIGVRAGAGTVVGDKVAAELVSAIGDGVVASLAIPKQQSSNSPSSVGQQFPPSDERHAFHARRVSLKSFHFFLMK
jgi:hypothetical protein